jgi:hypothetical protein
MQISGLSASNTFSATDVLAIEVNVNGVQKTYKLTGATLATALASIGSYLKTTDVVNNLTSNDPTKVAGQQEVYELNENLASYCKVVRKGKSNLNDSISAGSTKSYTFATNELAENGYLQIGIVGIFKYGADNQKAVLTEYYITSSYTAVVTFMNPTGSAVPITGVYLDILYKKN